MACLAPGLAGDQVAWCFTDRTVRAAVVLSLSRDDEAGGVAAAQDRIDQLKSRLIAEASGLRLALSTGPQGETVVDAGLQVPGSLEAGLLIAQLAMGGLGSVALVPESADPARPWSVAARASDPVLACLGSQYAGWPLHEPDRPDHALGSGPARALARREHLFDEIGATERVAAPILIVECRHPPSDRTVAEVSRACGIEPSALCLILVSTTTLPGSVQVAARALETTVAKARHAGFPLRHILDGMATCPLAPPHPDPRVAMGRTNDAIIYGSAGHLFVLGPASEARDLAAHLPSATSGQHGRLFADVFAEAGDFYAIDPLLFGSAAVRVTALEHGETFGAGRFEWGLIEQSFRRAD